MDERKRQVFTKLELCGVSALLLVELLLQQQIILSRYILMKFFDDYSAEMI